MPGRRAGTPLVVYAQVQCRELKTDNLSMVIGEQVQKRQQNPLVSICIEMSNS